MESRDVSEGHQWQGELAKIATVALDYLERRKKIEEREAKWRSVRRAVFIVAIAVAAISYGLVVRRLALGEGFTAPTVDSVALVRIEGEIAPGNGASAESLVPLIDKACKAEKTKILALQINSPGGSPAEAERIASAVDRCQSPDGTRKPVYAVIGSLGASAAYMIAMRADTIVAGKYSLVGSIGAIIRYIDASQAADRLGLSEQVFRSGPLKGGPSPLMPLSPADATLNQDMVRDLGHRFVEETLAARAGRLKVSAEELSSGRIWTSDAALSLGLIDRQGVLEDLRDREFKSLPIRTYTPAPPVSRWLGAAQALLRPILEGNRLSVE